jgi:hypothetical protein
MKKVIFTVFASAFLFSCSENEMNEEISADTLDSNLQVQAIDTMRVGTLKLYAVQQSPEFQDAILNLNSPTENYKSNNPVVLFDYELKNYELGSPTSGKCSEECANSAKGQHIHLILNNQPYQAKYTSSFKDTLKPGHYVALSFLSRSYHESIKHFDAYDLRQFTIGDVKEEKQDLTKPMLFYSRPKGEYKGKETKKVLLDFYLVNAALGQNQFKVKATINNDTITLTEWKGYVIEGLPLGKNKIKLELFDSHNKAVEGAYGIIEREISLIE